MTSPQCVKNGISDEDCFFLGNVMKDIQAYVDSLQFSENKKSVLLLPPVNNFRRFLSHKLVEETYSKDNLTTLSVGQLNARRTVVLPKWLLPMENRDNVLKHVEVKNTTPEKLKSRTCNVQIYRPPAARAEENLKNVPVRNKERKDRKPDMQIYVPRAKRLMCAAKFEKDSKRTVQQNSPTTSKVTKVPDENVHCEQHIEVPMKKPKDDTLEVRENKSDILEVTSHEEESVSAEKNELTDSYTTLISTDDRIIETEQSVNGTEEVPITSPECIDISSDSEDLKPWISVENGKLEDLVVSVLESASETPKTEIGEKSTISVGSDISQEPICISLIDDDIPSIIAKTSDIVNDPLHSRKKSEKHIENTSHLSEEAICFHSPSKGVITVDIPEVSLSAEKNCSAAKSTKKPAATGPSKPLDVDNCDWEELFDDSGEYVDKRLIDELMTAIGKVTVKRAAEDYRPYQTEEERSSDGECIVEVYGFPAEFKTDDLLSVFAAYRTDRAFQVAWVDDTHALAIFSSPIIADEVLNTELPFVKTRPLKNAIPKSRMKANNYVAAPATRPKTCVSLARRLVSGHLGMKINVTPKQREAEKKLLSDARAKKRLEAKQKTDAWEGTSTE